jgi:hypothetical protein
MVPNPRLELEVTGASSARFVSLDGTALRTDATKGLTVTATKLTATDPETFRKVWVELDGTQGATATVKATGTWGQGRTAMTSKTVTLGTKGARVFSATGGFAGPFGIYLQAYSGGPVLEVTLDHELELVRGQATVIQVTIREVTGIADATTVDLVLDLPAGTGVDASAQTLTVPRGGQVVANLSVFVNASAPKGIVGALVVSSDDAPPVSYAVKFVDEEQDGAGPAIMHWVLILVLAVVVVALIALPALGRRGAGGAGGSKGEVGAYQPDEREPGRET